MPVRTSVIIPAYNAAATVRATIDSVLAQTCPADQILVRDDGSTDETRSILETYGSRVQLLASDKNEGLCAGRNILCQYATGDLIALVDADDVWHPQYLESKVRLFEAYPNASLYFAGHQSLMGLRDVQWAVEEFPTDLQKVEAMEPLPFMRRYNRTPGLFYPSVWTFPRSALESMGPHPFQTAAEDAYFVYASLLRGGVVYLPRPLVAMRVLDGSLSTFRLRVYRGQVEAFRLLRQQYVSRTNREFLSVFDEEYAGARRQYAKLLMGAAQTAEGQAELLRALATSTTPASVAKAAALLFQSILPKSMQPNWPAPQRLTSTPS